MIPSPIDITNVAARKLPLETRALPSRGLNPNQMAQAIRDVGLEPLFIEIKADANAHYFTKSTVYSYIRSKIPVILGIDLVDICTTQRDSYENGMLLDRHAVTVTGYSLIKKSDPKPLDSFNFLLNASRIDKLYVHDDQVGPFARIEFEDMLVSWLTKDNNKLSGNSLSTSWNSRNYKENGKVKGVVKFVLVPVYNKIRIPFEYIHDMIVIFDKLIELLRQKGLLPYEERIIWDIYLKTTNKLKIDLAENGNIAADEKLNILTMAMPRFIWRTSAIIKDKNILDLFFDATDIEQGQVFLAAIEYDKDLSAVLHEIVKDSHIEKILNYLPVWKILEWYQKN